MWCGRWILGVWEEKGKREGGVHEPVGLGEGCVGGSVDVEGVEGGVGGVGEGEAGCVERGGRGGHGWQAMLTTVERIDVEARTAPTIIPTMTKHQLAVEQFLRVERSNFRRARPLRPFFLWILFFSAKHVTLCVCVCVCVCVYVIPRSKVGGTFP